MIAPPRVRSRRAGFTLIELLVGMTVGILLVVILFQIFNVAASAWQRGESQMDAYREARAALQLMTRDLSSVSAQFPANPAAKPAPVPGDPGLAPTLVLDKYPNPDPARKDEDAKNEEIYFLTTIPNTGLSSLCAVGYFCQWLPDIPPASDPGATRTPRAYSLFRQFLGSGQSTQPGLYELLTKATGAPLGFMDVFPRSRPNADNSVPDAAKVTATPVALASYIWDLQFRIDTNLTASAGGAAPASNGDAALWKKARKYSAADGDEHPIELPPYVEVRFKALSAGGARQLEGNSSVKRSTWWDSTEPLNKSVISRSTQQFVARVPLQNARTGLVVTPTP